jgi:hypothetical protein
MRLGTMITMRPDGSMTVVRRPSSEVPTLAELQGAVGGLIESVDRFVGGPGTRTVAYCNQELWTIPAESRLPNPDGTHAVNWPEPILGPVVIAHGFDPEWDAPECECLACGGRECLACGGLYHPHGQTQGRPAAVVGEIVSAIRRRST